MKCLTNISKEKKAIIEQAIIESGSSKFIFYRDEPDEMMNNYSDRDKYGSIWSSTFDASDFWAAYNRISKEI